MRLAVTDDNAGEYIIFFNGDERSDAFEADEETGKIWIHDDLSFSGYAVMQGNVVIYKKVNPHQGSIAGVRVNNGSEIILKAPIRVKEGDIVELRITFAQNGGIIESMQLIETEE